MMGIHQKQGEFWVEAVELSSRIPEGHILRKFSKALDLDFVRTEVAACYGRNGHVSLDPDATLKSKGRGESLPSYKNHRIVDDKAGVVTAVATTPSAVNEGHKLEELIEEHQSNTEATVRVATTDCQYGTAENFIALAKRGIRTHMGDLRSTQKNHRLKGIHPTEAFLYDGQSDTYTCPAGKTLRHRHWNSARNYAEYKARATDCARCPLRKQCTRAKDGRTVNRRPEQELLDRARAQSASAAGKADRRRRQHLQERNFADAANLHGFKRSRWRGLPRQSVQNLLIAAVQNLRILTGPTRRDAQAATAAPPGNPSSPIPCHAKPLAPRFRPPFALPATPLPSPPRRTRKARPPALFGTCIATLQQPFWATGR